MMYLQFMQRLYHNHLRCLGMVTSVLIDINRVLRSATLSIEGKTSRVKFLYKVPVGNASVAEPETVAG